MRGFIDFIRNEPAMVVAVVLAIANVVADVSAEQALHITTIVETVLLLLGGTVVRQSVTPVAKLKP